jgi:hypothetical protein
MNSECDHARPAAAEHDQPRPDPACDLSAMTPETARRLAAILAPHLMALRAVTAGTRYGAATRLAAPCDQAVIGTAEPPVSPATVIFIAGMLERMSA